MKCLLHQVASRNVRKYEFAMNRVHKALLKPVYFFSREEIIDEPVNMGGGINMKAETIGLHSTL